MIYPEILFKYREVNEYTLMSLINRSVWFSNASMLNDPFDCQIILKNKVPNRKEFEKLTGRAFERLGQKLGGKLISVAPKYCFDGDKLSEHYINEILRFKKHIESNLKSIGILSLSSKEDNTTMWSHYAGSHTGICIGYKTKNLFPKNNLKEMLHEVQYRPAEKINFNVFDLYAQCCCNQDKQEYKSIMDNIVATKTDDWSYEKEWRLINGNIGNHFAGEEAITAVYFGLKASLDAKVTIRNILADVPMIFYQMVRSENGLGVEPIWMRTDSEYWTVSPE